MAADPTDALQVATKRYVDNNAPSTEPWRILGVIRPSTNVTSVNFTGLNISPPTIMRLVAVIRSSVSSGSAPLVHLRVNNEGNSSSWTAIEVYPGTTYVTYARHVSGSPIAYLYSSGYVTVITCTIAVDPSGFVAATSQAGHQTLSGSAGTPDVRIFYTIREGGAVTSLTSIALVAALSNSIGANSVFYLEYLAP
jgi:hypothetical protein